MNKIADKIAGLKFAQSVLDTAAFKSARDTYRALPALAKAAALTALRESEDEFFSQLAMVFEPPTKAAVTYREGARISSNG